MEIMKHITGGMPVLFGDLSHIDSDTLMDHLVDYLLGGLGASTATQADE